MWQINLLNKKLTWNPRTPFSLENKLRYLLVTVFLFHLLCFKLYLSVFSVNFFCESETLLECFSKRYYEVLTKTIAWTLTFLNMQDKCFFSLAAHTWQRKHSIPDKKTNRYDFGTDQHVHTGTPCRSGKIQEAKRQITCLQLSYRNNLCSTQ